jgi:NAD(P)-dependent dehydrogenase (short-subunit alcohol dehydrogenase family)
MEAQRLRDRVAVVTGAARGIGKAIARRLAVGGAALVVADIDGAQAVAVADEIAGLGARAIACATDITSDAAVTELRLRVEAAFGRCDILVNNAAILDATRFESLTLDRFQAVMDVNLNGTLRVVLALAPLMGKLGNGRIINIASIMGVRGSTASIPYSTAKAGLVNLTRCLACDLAPDGVRVNAIAPGFVNTRMALLPDGSGHETVWFRDIYIKHGRIPLRRPAEPDDVAGVAYFLASDDAAYVTGQVLLVDGGISATF